MTEISTPKAEAKGVFKVGSVMLAGEWGRVCLDDAVTMEFAEYQALKSAIRLLANVHTRDDREAGFTVEACASDLLCDRAGYINAWETLRRAAGLPVDSAPFSEGANAA